MSTSKDIGIATDPSREILESIQSLSAKIDRMEAYARLPHLTASTLATALLLTGITKRVDIAKSLGTSTKNLMRSPEFSAFRLAEGSIRASMSVSRRGRSRDDFTDD